MQIAEHCEPMHVSADEAREDDLSLSPHLLLLALPFDAADRIFALRWRRRLSRALEFLCALAGDLKRCRNSASAHASKRQIQLFGE